MKRLLIFCILFSAWSAWSQKPGDTLLLKKHLLKITGVKPARNSFHPASLDSIAAYIFAEFSKYSDTVWYQHFEARGGKYKNVICSMNTNQKDRIVVGAHYDVCGEQDGADDNASGVAGLLEIVRALKGIETSFRIDLVAYSLEEPPNFNTENMGSFVHAKFIHENKIPVIGMISLDMIGYFSEKEKTQTYPVKEMEKEYGNKANFITVALNDESSDFGEKMAELIKKSKKINTVIFKSDKLELSDHINYRKYKIPTFMITDSAFYRNRNYHTSKDRLETLNLAYMQKTIQAIIYMLEKIKN